MSLINDALRRARDLAAGQTRHGDSVPEYRLAVRPDTMRRSWVVVATLAAIAGLALAALLFSRWVSHVPAAVATEPPAAVSTPPAAEEELLTRLLARLQQTQTVSVAVNPDPTATVAAPPPVVVPPEPPKLVLQGITADANGREAMINGVSVRVGEEIEGCHVTAIDNRQVRLRFGERELTLRMP